MRVSQVTDLLMFTHYRNRTAPPEDGEREIVVAKYSTLTNALQHRWSGLSRRQTKELNPAAVFSVLGELSCPFYCKKSSLKHLTSEAVWEYQLAHNGALPDSTEATSELDATVERLMTDADLNRKGLTSVVQDYTS